MQRQNTAWFYEFMKKKTFEAVTFESLDYYYALYSFQSIARVWPDG